MNNMTEKPLAATPIKAARTGWLVLIERYSLIWLSLLLLVVLPLLLGDFRLGLAGKYLSLAFCAVGMVMIWGYGAFSASARGYSSAWAAT